VCTIETALGESVAMWRRVRNFDVPSDPRNLASYSIAARARAVLHSQIKVQAITLAQFFSHAARVSKVPLPPTYRVANGSWNVCSMVTPHRPTGLVSYD